MTNLTMPIRGGYSGWLNERALPGLRHREFGVGGSLRGHQLLLFAYTEKRSRGGERRMPRGVYERTPEQLERLREQARRINGGRKLSPEHRAKLREAWKSRTDTPWNKGKKLDPLAPEHRAKISESLCGRPVSDKAVQALVERSTTHGHARRGRQSDTYRCWAAMLRRCFNSNVKDFPNYGGRGITVCDRWLSFENFLADMGERPKGLSIDRVDCDGNYEPGNCRWATPKEQAANRRPRKR